MQLLDNRFIPLVAAATLIQTLGCIGAPVPPPVEQEVGERLEYVIGVTDVLGIRVWKNPDLNVQAVVRNDGKISVPLVDDVQAEGLTAEELKEVITEELSEYIAAPDVTVLIIQANSRTVSVMGAVARSGLTALSKDMRVLEAIAAHGGFTTWARRDQVRILRRTPNGIVEYRFNYSKFLAGKSPHSNILLKSGDTIIVPD